MFPIASLGTNSAYVQLFASLEGDSITLKATATEWCAMTGEMRKDEIVEKKVSIEEAYDAAADIQGMAKEFLDERGSRGWFTKNMNFEDATGLFIASKA